ncbi:hypothetical protein B296_00005571 [Ensete ventricosum]|uniref:Uncharacterized protein n=1 Tax=Ensete ventricosum TaxID=4639 RepID=A0A427AET2_ENSVE|nr:hypothetical protein B296_00005571 [Ensete ventricosum]
MTIRIGQRQVYASGRGSNDAVRNSLGVHWKVIEGIGSLLGWRKGVRQKKTETRQKIVEVAETLTESWEGHDVYRIDGGDRLIRHGGPTLSLGKVSYRAPYTYYPHIATDASEEQIARTRTVTFGKTLLGTHSPVTLASDQPNKTTPF